MIGTNEIRLINIQIFFISKIYNKCLGTENTAHFTVENVAIDSPLHKVVWACSSINRATLHEAKLLHHFLACIWMKNECSLQVFKTALFGKANKLQHLFQMVKLRKSFKTLVWSHSKRLIQLSSKPWISKSSISLSDNGCKLFIWIIKSQFRFWVCISEKAERWKDICQFPYSMSILQRWWSHSTNISALKLCPYLP